MALTKLIILATLLMSSTITMAKTYHVYFLGGQSNMEGYGYNKDLPSSLQSFAKVVPIFHGSSAFDTQPGGGLGLWTELQPGHGTGFTTDGKANQYSDRFGLEITLAHSLLKDTEHNIAFVKYATGGTGLSKGVGYSNWDTDFAAGDNQYNFAIKTIQTALATKDIDGDGSEDKLIPAGIIWMQGEADAHHSIEAANAYETKITTLMQRLRNALGNESLPIALGKINRLPDQGPEPEMPYMDTVIKAQARFAENDVCAEYVTETEEYTISNDRWHYDSDAFIKMGRAFAKAILKLKSC